MRISFRLLIAAALSWSGLAHSSSAQGLGVGINLGGLGVGVSIGSPSTPTSPGNPLGLNLSIGSSGGSSGSGSGGTASSTVTVLSQQAALDAVSSRQAVPLDSILAKARLFNDGEVVGAQLISYRGFLLYDLRMLAPTGDVSELYFYARSGEQVQTK